MQLARDAAERRETPPENPAIAFSRMLPLLGQPLCSSADPPPSLTSTCCLQLLLLPIRKTNAAEGPGEALSFTVSSTGCPSWLYVLSNRPSYRAMWVGSIGSELAFLLLLQQGQTKTPTPPWPRPLGGLTEVMELENVQIDCHSRESVGQLRAA